MKFLPWRTIMENLESLLKSLYLISGLNMSLFDINGNLLASYPHQKCPFCYALSKNPEALAHCTASDQQAIEHVKREEKIYIYQCHFHLYEGIMPLYSYGSLTGYLMLGQTITKSPIHHAQVIETASPFFENKEELYDTVSKISVHSKEQIIAFAQVSDTCAKYLSLTNQVQRKNENLAQEIKRYLHKNFNSQGLSIESLCKHFSCSRGTLINHFKTRYHITIHQYLLELRLKESCELLKNPNLSIKEIAIQCGFSDPNYYSKAFKKMYHCSPIQYRNS